MRKFILLSFVLFSQMALAQGEWPRQISTDNAIYTIYQPQVETWKNNQLEERAAISVENKASPIPVYGVMWFTARTEIDKENRQVSLEDIQITKVNFPTVPDKTQAYLSDLKANAIQNLKTVSLDRLQASLAITKVESTRTAQLKNSAPEIIFNSNPSVRAVLVLIDGKSVLRETGVGGLLRVINTRQLILFDPSNAKYYLSLGKTWMTASKVEGPWKSTNNINSSLNQAKQVAVSAKQVEEINGVPGTPQIFVRTGPAELVQTQGAPQLQPISNTNLLYVSNTQGNIFLNPGDQKYYILISGRWYRASSLKSGSDWSFVSSKDLPSEFSKIPETHPKGDVLASVAGTQEAGEAAISNQIPQTATVDRSKASLEVAYDGSPEFKTIEGTSLRYAVNAGTPVIEVDPESFYSVQNGVWFSSASPQGPWTVAEKVPAVIYSIPPSSPLYYVTYVYVYGSTPRYVYSGYLPGYLGSYVNEDGVVVYGTGYYYTPWVGTVWIGAPWTFGWGVSWGFGGFGFTAGFYHPWWGPWGWGYAHGGWGGWAGPGFHYAGITNTNVYHGWGRSVVRNTFERNRPAPVNAFHGTQRPNNFYAGHEGNIYRSGAQGWEKYNSEGKFEQHSPEQARSNNLPREQTARQQGEQREQNFNTTKKRNTQLGGVSGEGFGRGGFGGFKHGR